MRCFILCVLELLAFDSTQIKTPVSVHKLYDGIELLIEKTGIVRDNRDCDNRADFAVLMIDLGNRDVEPAL